MVKQRSKMDHRTQELCSSPDTLTHTHTSTRKNSSSQQYGQSRKECVCLPMNSVQIFAIARLSLTLLLSVSSFMRVFVCVSVSITYVCQLSRFLRGLMVKSYYVQTTVNKYRYSSMVWCKWLWPHGRCGCCSMLTYILESLCLCSLSRSLISSFSIFICAPFTLNFVTVIC